MARNLPSTRADTLYAQKPVMPQGEYASTVGPRQGRVAPRDDRYSQYYADPRENYNIFDEGVRDRLWTSMVHAPIGGYVRRFGEDQLGLSRGHARLLEMGAAASAVGVGVGTFLAAVQSLNENTQTPGTILIQ